MSADKDVAASVTDINPGRYTLALVPWLCVYPRPVTVSSTQPYLSATSAVRRHLCWLLQRLTSREYQPGK